MRENNFNGVQEIAAQGREGYVSHTQLHGCSIKGVANHGMFERGKMDAYLMGAAGVKLDLQQRRGVNLKKGAPIGTRFAGVINSRRAFSASPSFLFRGHAYTLQRVSADGQLDSSVVALE